MKIAKKLITLTVAAFLSVGAFAIDHGPMIGIDYTTSAIKYTYISETITYRVDIARTFAFDFGVRMMENFVPQPNEPIFTVTPLIDIYTGTWYLGGGLQITPEQPEDGGRYMPYARTGFMFPGLKIGVGEFNVNLGIELSPTVFAAQAADDSASSQIGAGLGSLFGTLINSVKANIGVAYYIPLKK